MTRAALCGAALCAAIIAAAGLVIVAVHEFGYASGHPYAYGPAKVIAWGALAGALGMLAVALVAVAVLRDDGR